MKNEICPARPDLDFYSTHLSCFADSLAKAEELLHASPLALSKNAHSTGFRPGVSAKVLRVYGAGISRGRPPRSRAAVRGTTCGKTGPRYHLGVGSVVQHAGTH